MTIELKRVDKGHKNESWKMELREKVMLIDPDGKAVVELDPADAVSRFRMPNFWQNIRYFGVRLEDGLWEFDLRKSDVRWIEQFINRTLAAGGRETIGIVWRAAVRDIVIGGFAIICGVGATVLGYKEAASNPRGGEYAIYYGMVIFGVLALGRGFLGLRRHRELQSISATASFGPQWGERPVPGAEQTDEAHGDVMVGDRRIPLLKLLVASLIVFACVEGYVLWREMRPGPASAHAVPASRPYIPPSSEVPASFKPTPPSAARLQELELSAIEGLRECAALVGRYPESPDTSAPCFQEDLGRLREDLAWKMRGPRVDAAALKERMEFEEKYTRITHFVTFCNVLREWTKERAYYGRVVKPGEAERVLLRWQLAPNEYRVIFGDLHAENVTAGRLAQLEATLPK